MPVRQLQALICDLLAVTMEIEVTGLNLAVDVNLNVLTPLPAGSNP